jgi:hypothetical protein
MISIWNSPAPAVHQRNRELAAVTACARPARVWDGYAGGFYLRSSAACVPLVFHNGDRSTTVLFSVGRRCG